jgi:pyruvate-formate lyase-activating enzyme
MAVCAALWTHIKPDVDGHIYPCCRWSLPKNEIKMYGLESTIAKLPKISDGTQAALDSDYFNSIRERMLAGEELSECKQCTIEEKANDGTSMRTEMNDQYGHHINEAPKIRYIELMFSTHCNLACRMCGEYASSKWKLINNPNLTVDTSIDSSDLENYDSDFSKLDTIKVVGGEPLLAKDHYDFLDKFISQSDNPENISISYHTNSTIFPNKNIINYWKKLKIVKIIVSVDAYGELNTYLRPGSSWKKINETIEKFKNIEDVNIELTTHTVVTSLNVLQLHKLIEWREEMELEGTFHVTDGPWHLAISHLVDEEKDKIRTYLNSLRTKYTITPPVFLQYTFLIDVIEEALNENQETQYTFEDIAKEEQKLDKYFNQDFWDNIQK